MEQIPQNSSVNHQGYNFDRETTSTRSSELPNLIHPNPQESHIIPPSILNKEIEDDDEYFSRLVSSRWPGVARESIASSVPHLRGIKSWTRDQFERQNGKGKIGEENVPDMPQQGGYVKM